MNEYAKLLNKKSGETTEGSEAPWGEMARELATAPHSPASLQIMSMVNGAVRPNVAAVAELVRALADQLEHPGPEADAAVCAAATHWEATCEAEMTHEILRGLRQEAHDFVERRRRQ